MAKKENKKAKKGMNEKAKAALEKARKLKAKGGGKKTKAEKKAKKPGTFSFKAPSDFKPHDLIVAFRTDKDGLIGSDFEAVRYQGRFAEEVDDKKKFVMSTYDPATLLAIAARMNGLAFNTNAIKFFPEDVDTRNQVEKFKNNEGEKKERLVFRGKHRLPKSTTFRCLFRVGKKSADGSLTVSLKKMWQQGENKKGRVVYLELEKNDPVVKVFKGAKRGGMIAPAFKNVLMPPKKNRARKTKDESDDE